MDKELDELISIMGQVWRHFRQRSQVSFEQKTRTMLQMWVLGFLHENPNTTVGELASHLKMSMSSATQVAKRLVKAKLAIAK